LRTLTIEKVYYPGRLGRQCFTVVLSYLHIRLLRATAPIMLNAS